MSNRRKLQRVLKRDGRLCGVHMGGCGRPIEIGEPATRDHIVPTSLYSKVATDRVAEFDRPWNCQPMHKACNEAKGSILAGWPRFDCDCHYLQIHGRDLYVHTKGPAGDGRHKILENVVSDKDDRVDARVVVGEGGVKGVGPVFGYWQGQVGYLFPGIAASRVELFNLTERGAVGLPVPETLRLDDAGRVVRRWGIARIVRRRSRSAETRFRRGHCLAELGRLEEALQEFDAAVRAQPSMAKAYWRRGVANGRLERIEEALADLDRAIELAPNVAEAYFDRGVTKGRLGRHTESIADYDEVIRITPDMAGAYCNRGSGKGQLGDHEAAVADFDRALALKPGDAKSLNNRAASLRELGRLREAATDSEAAAARCPRSAEIHYNLGCIRLNLGETDEGKRKLEAALELASGEDNEKVIALATRALARAEHATTASSRRT